VAKPFGIQVVTSGSNAPTCPRRSRPASSPDAGGAADCHELPRRGEEKARRSGGRRPGAEVLLARAYSTSQRLRGEGDAQATAVTGRAFGQDAGFYAFLRRLETYERIFVDGTTTILLRPDSDLLRYLETPRPRR
jgi:membrane protease subunit HflC